MIKNVTMGKMKILIVGSGPFGFSTAEALALKHKQDFEIITTEQAEDLGIGLDLIKAPVPKPYIFENIRIEDLPQPYLTDLKPKYPNKNNWKRKLKKNKR